MPGTNLPPLRPVNGMMDPRYQATSPLEFHLVPAVRSREPGLQPSCAFHQRDQLHLLSRILDKLEVLSSVLEELRSVKSVLSQAPQREHEVISETVQQTLKGLDSIKASIILAGLKENAPKRPSPSTPKAMEDWDMTPCATELPSI